MNYASEEKESLGIRKRTIGNVDYEEEIIRINQFTMEDSNIDREYIWAEKDKMHELTLSGPHRKWIEEIF